MKHRETSSPIAIRVREILEAAPEAVDCGKGFLDRAARFAETLEVWGSRTNLTAHPEDPVEIAFHVVDSLAPLFVDPPLDLFPGKVRVLDLGSGAGFPGLILAAAIDSDFTLVEARRKRASFLSAAATEMGLTNVTVVCQRATSANVNTDFDVLTSRGVGDASLEIAAKVLRAEGTAILWASPEQTIQSQSCSAAGLGQSTRLDYTVKHGSKTARRSLLVIKKTAS